jgi:hypothetical protein
MTYIVAPNGIYSHRAATGNVVWDDTHTCPADKLKPEEAELFGVFPLVEVDPPPCGPDKTAVPEDPTLVDGQWLQQWAVRDATTDEMAQRALEARERFKAERAAAVRAITVTTAAGNTFDGDETSQDRMVRAIVALQATGTPSVVWVLADNSTVQATAAELAEALALAGAAQAALWVAP